MSALNMSAFKLALCLIADKHNAPADVMTIIGKDVARHQAFTEVLKDIENCESGLLAPHPYYSQTITDDLLRDALRVEHGGWCFWDYAEDREDLCDENGCLEYLDEEGREESILWTWSSGYWWMEEWALE
jgi:hypothetical protein